MHSMVSKQFVFRWEDGCCAGWGLVGGYETPPYRRKNSRHHHNPLETLSSLTFSCWCCLGGFSLILIHSNLIPQRSKLRSTTQAMHNLCVGSTCHHNTRVFGGVSFCCCCCYYHHVLWVRLTSLPFLQQPLHFVEILVGVGGTSLRCRRGSPWSSKCPCERTQFPYPNGSFRY